MFNSILLVHWDFAISLSVIGYLIVLLALMFLFVIYTIIPKVLGFITNYFERKKQNGNSKKPQNIPQSGEISAAISAALYLYLNEQHDDESGKMTIKKVSKTYSPWSSKIYGLRQPLNK